MNYESFKNDCSKLNVFDLLDKWKNHPNYEEYERKKYDEDFYEYVCEYYNYDEYLIRGWKIFKNTCELYVKCLNDS